MHLYIGYKNYSSWSLRPWIAMKVAGIEFEETILPFYHSDALKVLASTKEIPAAVPILEVNEQIIWDSMAIMEYLADIYPDANLWPSNMQLRALARACSAEIHSGFMSLRSQFPMNCRATCQKEPSEGTKQDLLRLATIWGKFSSSAISTQKTEGPFLCGHFTIVDAMYAPVMWRIRGYGLEVSPAFSKWTNAMLALPAMQEWLESAQKEQWKVPQYDAISS
jgi:glutathione S-transferase